MEQKIILPIISPEVELKLYKKLNRKSLEKLWRNLENENNVIYVYLNELSKTLQSFQNLVNVLDDPDFQSIMHINESKIFRYSGTLTYFLLKNEQKKLNKNLPLVSKETAEAFCREEKEYYTSLEKKIQQDDALIFLPTTISQELIEEFWEEKSEIQTFARTVGRYGVHLAYGLLHRQAESDELKELFDL